MNPVYNAGIALYSGAARIAACGSAKVRDMLAGQKETLARLRQFRSSMAPEGFDVWFHAASLGEFEQARPMIEAILQTDPEKKILLSFFSPSGYKVRSNFNPRVAVVYMPFDKNANVRAFLDAAAPRMAVFVKYEFWGNYLAELRRRHIPTYIISAIFRPGQIFFKPWGRMFRSMLADFDRLYVQDERSRLLLAAIGINKVTVAGDTRFDRVTAIKATGRKVPEIECFKAAAPEALTLVAGSSWGRDEDIYAPWLSTHSCWRGLIAPHEFNAERLEALRTRFGKDCTMLLSEFSKLYESSPSEAARRAASLRFLIIDCFGLLSSLYAYADVAYVGGGFGVGIHNINEAAVYGIPVIFGPNHHKFNEAAGLIACKGGFSVESAKSLARIMDALTLDADARTHAGEAAGKFIADNIGATEIIMKDLFPSTTL